MRDLSHLTYKIVSSMSIGENGTWDPSASPVLSLCSVTIVSEKVKKGQHPSGQVGAGAPRIAVPSVFGFSRPF